MKYLFTIAIALTCFNLATFGQTEEEMKKWMEYMTPSEVHKMMASWDGTWDEEITMWMDDKSPAEKMKATCVNKMVLGGRHQQTTHIGSMMGQPFEGFATLSWDNASKSFGTTWVDNMGTGLMYLEGTWDEGNKTINFSGKMMDPLSGKSVKIRETFKIIDANTQEVTQYTEKEGKEYKSMHIMLTRKK